MLNVALALFLVDWFDLTFIFRYKENDNSISPFAFLISRTSAMNKNISLAKCNASKYMVNVFGLCLCLVN